MKIKDPELFRLIKEFLTVYLPKIHQKSINTVDSYRYAINLYLTYIQESKAKKLKDIETIDFRQNDILEFMEWLKFSRDNEIITINQRLSHIRSFCCICQVKTPPYFRANAYKILGRSRGH